MVIGFQKFLKRSHTSCCLGNSKNYQKNSTIYILSMTRNILYIINENAFELNKGLSKLQFPIFTSIDAIFYIL